MMNKPALCKITVINIMMLVSILLCLNIGACNCDNPALQDEPQPKGRDKKTKQESKEKQIEIIPISPQNLAQKYGKSIKYKIQKVSNSDAIDLSKLSLTITLSDPSSTIKYNGNAVQRLAGDELELEKCQELILHTPNSTEEVTITLQLLYDNQPLPLAASQCVWIWNKKTNEITKKFLKAVSDKKYEDAKSILGSNSIDIQPNASLSDVDDGDLTIFQILAMKKDVDEQLITQILSLPGVLLRK